MEAWMGSCPVGRAWMLKSLRKLLKSQKAYETQNSRKCRFEKENCKIVILTYVGRPDGHVVEQLRTTPHAKKLSEFLNHPVDKIDDCIGPKVDNKISHMQSGDILMLENVRFYNEEMIDDDIFAQKLCRGKDLIV